MVMQLTSFIGRTHELAEIADLLADPACRLLTLVGPGGIGKTRLALEVMQSLNFPQGVHFVSLQPVSDAALLPIAIANAIGIQFFGSDEPRVQLLNFLRERQTLLILDNFEHLLDGIDFVVELLSAPGVKLLVTSRTALNIQAEWRYTVSGLDVPPIYPHPPAPSPLHGEGGSKSLALTRTRNDWDEGFENFDAVKLFTERARRLRHDFSLDEQRTHVIRICELTEGMPLALELAAGWIKVLSCAEIANEMQRGLEFLAADLRDMPERHRSMAAAFSQSWHLLTDDEQKIFRRMSVFRGGFTRDAAEKVTDANLQILAVLVDKSLLRVSAEGRYDIHELMRQYGEAKLEAAGETGAIHDAHSRYYLCFLADLDADIKGRRQQAALAEIKQDFENIRMAWIWAADHRHHIAISMALDMLVNAAEMNNNLLETQSLLQQTLAAFAPTADVLPDPVWDQVTVRLERVNFMLDSPMNVSRVESILERTRERGNDHEIAYCLWSLGNFAYRSGDLLAKFSQFEECLALRCGMGDQFYFAHTLVQVHSVYIARGETERGLDCLRESVRIRREMGDKCNLPYPLTLLANRLMYFGNFGEIQMLLDEALAIQEEIGRVPAYAFIQGIKADMAFLSGDFDTAVRHVQTGLDFTRGHHYINTTKGLYAVQSHLACLSGDYQRGRDICQQHRSDQFRSMVAAKLEWGLTLAYCGLGDDEAANESLQNTLRIATGNLRLVVIQQLCLPLAAILEARKSHHKRAVELLGLAYTLPAALMGWMDDWMLLTQLRSTLEMELGSQHYAAAWERGKVFDLETATAEMMTEFRVSDTPVDPNHQLADPLTPRELEVLRLVAQGHSNRQIADELVIANTTVRGYVHVICQKLGAQNRTHALVRAKELRLL